MKLKTSLQIGALFPVVLAMIVSLSLFLRARQMSNTLEKINGAQSMIITASQLSETAYRCVYQSDKSAIAKWPGLYDEMTKIMLAVKSDEVAEQVTIDRARNALEMANQMFAQVSVGRGAQQETSSGSQLLAYSHDIAALASELANNTINRAGATQSFADTVFMVFIAVIGLMMAIDMLSISRQMFGRVSSLTESAVAITRGDLAQKIPADATQDEIGKLSSALRAMVEELKKTHQELQTEVVEHKRIAQSARDANIRLSDALSKLKIAQQQIVRSERLHALEQIAKGVTQNFNDMLLPIVASTDYLLRYPENFKNEQILMDRVKGINEAARLATRSVSDLYEFFRPGKSAGGATVNINDLVEQAITMTQPRWDDTSRSKDRKINIQTDLKRIPSIPGDEGDLRQSIVSLMMNSIDALPNGGSITASSALDAGMIVLKVADTGVGMSDEVRRRCLEPFFSTKERGATGMGLAVVSNVVRRHEGVLNIVSEPGKGTTVTLRLPTKVQAREPVQPSVKLARPVKILVIDDEETARELASRMFKEDGHSVKTASGAQSGLEELKASTFDVAVVDEAMPETSGKELVLKIKELAPATKIIMLTGLADLLTDDGSFPEGVDTVVAKPASFDDLRAALAKVVLQK
jgi:signal transduction histidine kinase